MSSLTQRRLTAVMFTDMVGYTALGQRDESLSLALVNEQRKLIRAVLARHNGKEVKTMGDALLLEFTNALDAVRCAYDIQRVAREFNYSQHSDQKLNLRIGIHLGDVTESLGDIMGDAVNVASRIQLLAEDGGVCVTRQVFDQVQNKFELPLNSLGIRSLKGVAAPLEVYGMVLPWDNSRQNDALKLDSRRIAVLPFANMSADPNDAYLADGVTEEIISTLSGVSGLSVISRTSVIGYRGTAKKAKEMGLELGVGSILEGSFRRDGDKIRVTAQLIDVGNDRHVWAQNYDRKLDDIFAVQTNIARQVTDALRVRILAQEAGRIERKPTESREAYDLYLRGRYHWNNRTIEDIKKAADYFRRALRKDPKFALGYVGLADCYEMLSANWGIEEKRNYSKAKKMLDTAAELDEELAEAHATQGTILLNDLDFKAAEEEFRKSIELKPSYATGHQWYALLLEDQLKWDEALMHLEKAVELDPFSQIINLNHALWYYLRKDYPKALELTMKAVELNPSSWGAHFQLRMVFAKMRRYGEMRQEERIGIRLMKKSHPYVVVGAALFTANLIDDKRTVRRLLPKFEALFGKPMITAYWISGVYFYLGEHDRGFEWLRKSLRRKERDLSTIKHDENFDGVRDDPRYQKLLQRIGLD